MNKICKKWKVLTIGKIITQTLMQTIGSISIEFHPYMLCTIYIICKAYVKSYQIKMI